MAQKVQIHQESRIFDFVYDPTYALTSRDFAKADTFARHHFLSARQAKSDFTDLDGLLTVRPLFTADHKDISSSDTNLNNCQSIVVHGRQSPRYVSSVNRPISAGDRHKPVPLSKPLLYTPIQTPALQEDRRTSMKTDLESSLRSSSSGYHSVRSQAVPTSAKVQAIIERLYHGHQPGRQCSRCSYGGYSTTGESGHLSSPQSPSLPQVNAKDVELVESMRAKRRIGRHAEDTCSRSTESVNKSHTTSSLISSSSRRFTSPRRLASPVRDNNQQVDFLRQKLATHTENLRKDIEEKLKRMRISHDRALQRLQNEHKPRSRDRSSATKLSTENLYATTQFKQMRKSKEEKNISNENVEDLSSFHPDNFTNDDQNDNLIMTNGDTNDNLVIMSDDQNQSDEVEVENQAKTDEITVIEKATQTEDVNVEENQNENQIDTNDKSPESEIVLENVVDAITVQDEIIKPLVDFIISESIISVANYRANEEIALALIGRKSKTTPSSVIKDVNEFFSKNLLPSSIHLVQKLLHNDAK